MHNHDRANTSASTCIATTNINQRHQPAHQHIFVAYIRNMLKHSKCEKRQASVANWWLIIHISINTDITSIIITTKSSTIVVLLIRQYANNANNKKNINTRNTTSTKIGNVSIAKKRCAPTTHQDIDDSNLSCLPFSGHVS